jgi:hypothetical protein
MSDPSARRILDALEGLDAEAARKRALDATINYARSRLRTRTRLRGAALQSVLDRARQRFRHVIRRVFDGRLTVQAAAFVLEASADAIVVDYRRREKGIKRSRGRPLTGRGVLARSYIILLELDPPDRLALLADVRSDLFDDANSEGELLDAIRHEIDQDERRRARERRKAGADFGVTFTAAIRVPKDRN